MGGMLRGRLPFDGVKFAEGAVKLDSLAHEPWQHFPQVRDEGDSSARADVWERQARFQDLARQLEGVTGELVTVTRNPSLDATQMKAPMDKVEAACKACHSEFLVHATQRLFEPGNLVTVAMVTGNLQLVLDGAAFGGAAGQACIRLGGLRDAGRQAKGCQQEKSGTLGGALNGKLGVTLRSSLFGGVVRVLETGDTIPAQLRGKGLNIFCCKKNLELFRFCATDPRRGLPCVSRSGCERRPVGLQRHLLRQGRAQRFQPLVEGAQVSRAETVMKLSGPGVAETRHLRQDLGVELQPVHEGGHQAGIHQSAPGHGLSHDRAMYHVVKPRNGEAGKADGHLVARANIEFLPASQGTKADLGNLTVVQFDRRQMQDGGYLASASNAKAHFAHLGQCLGEGAACLGLHMALQAFVQFPLQHQVHRLRQLSGDGAERGNMPAPVMALEAIATAEQPDQPTLLVDQGNRDAVDLGLYPDIAFVGQPTTHCLFVRELVDAGVDDRVCNRTACACQWGGRRVWQVEAPL
ncbi:hypothetical protein WR25_17934 [Diploscapter pachys]|uniref:Uncharacterized protein n=1 Tax=Diploscapter pachys TaxID=2018661 RepID=A0A2A2K2B3_9BILA|nr:hypothetical protein WR25_17934 [Diploscapter pachys]